LAFFEPSRIGYTSFVTQQKSAEAGQSTQAPKKLHGKELRRVMEEFRDTKDDRRAEELKKIISSSICGG
jgi:hypothetical protein